MKKVLSIATFVCFSLLFSSFVSNLHCMEATEEICDTYKNNHDSYIESMSKIIDKFKESEFEEAFNNEMYHQILDGSRKKVDSGTNLENANFEGRTLEKVIFLSCNLKKAKFKNATLKGVVFIGCALNESDFSNSQVTSVEFIHSDLTRASFDGCRTTIFSGSIPTKSSDRMDFFTQRISGASHSEVLRIVFWDSNMSETSMRNICFMQPIFFRSKIDTVNFSNSALFAGRLSMSEVSNSDFTDTCFMAFRFGENSIIGNTKFIDAQFYMCIFDEITVDSSNFSRATFNSFFIKGGLFKDTTFRKGSFFVGRIYRVRFKKTIFVERGFSDIELDGSEFEDCRLDTCAFCVVACSLRDIRFLGGVVNKCLFEKTDFNNAFFRNVIFTETRIYNDKFTAFDDCDDSEHLPFVGAFWGPGGILVGFGLDALTRGIEQLRHGDEFAAKQCKNLDTIMSMQECVFYKMVGLGDYYQRSFESLGARFESRIPAALKEFIQGALNQAGMEGVRRVVGQ